MELGERALYLAQPPEAQVMPPLVIDFFGAEVLCAFLPDQARACARLEDRSATRSSPRTHQIKSDLRGAVGHKQAPTTPEATEGLLDMVCPMTGPIVELADGRRGRFPEPGSRDLLCALTDSDVIAG
jgi:hypothetical protein